MNTSLLPATTHVGSVALTVASLDESLPFYRDVLGFAVASRTDATATLAAGGSGYLVELAELPGARPKPRHSTGLYHFAILVPSRLELARALRRLVMADWPLQGVADHGVSEALYLADPDGNGIEIYVDRPREQWPRRIGQLQMTTDPLDLANLLQELDRHPRSDAGLAPDTSIGHVHLHVASLPEAEAFYCSVLGFDVTQRNYPGALFLSAGGYHHHVGLNTWAGAGAPPPPADAAGLRYFTVVVPDGAALESLVARAEATNLAVEPQPTGWLLRDPSRNGVLLVNTFAASTLPVLDFSI
jgi:catechol 2,3-dioxygenase